MARKIDWTERARADLRGIDRQTAMHILRDLGRFAASGVGDVKQLQGVNPPQMRLRSGDYRVRYSDHGDHIEILSVRHRREAYR